MRKALSEEDLNWIVAFALEQATVEDVLDVIYICWGYSCIITTPPKSWKGGEWPPGILNDIDHFPPIYRHAIRLVESQDDALLIYESSILDGIPRCESLVAFLISLEFCDSVYNLDCLVDTVLKWVNNPGDLFSYEEELLALFEKRRELLENERGD